MKIKGLTALAVAALIALVFAADSGFAQGLPAPAIYKGTVTVGGSPVPDGYRIYARIENYQSESVRTKDGRYEFLIVSPPVSSGFNASSRYNNRTINFYLDGVQAAETATYVVSSVHTLSQPLNLTFTNLPVPPTPIPTNTPIPTPTAPATPTPSVADQMTFSTGLIVAVTGAIPENAQLTARIGDYTSEPATIAPDGNYFGLIVNPGDVSLIGQEIKFFLNGIESRTTRAFVSGEVVSQFDLNFNLPEAPAPTPEPTATPEPPTPTPVPTETPIPPTATPVPPTATPVPPATNTPPPTATPVPSTATPPPPPTATPVPEPTNTPPPPPTNTPMAPEAPPPPSAPEQAGGCSSATDSLPFGTAAANLALLLAPLGLLGIRKLTIRHR